ncbi:MAG: leishmanolysin-related zinc metalloendopeptidase, partial [Gemmatimonadales bacterium]
GQLNDVVFHEMQHVLGFGTLWTTAMPMLIINAGTPQTAFTGAAGIRGCQQAGGVPSDCLPSIPLESTGGPGTADGHWRWSIFGDELMTAFLPAPGTPKLLSAMTIGSLSDLGYQTNGNVADAYTIPSAVAASSLNLRMALGLTLSDAQEVVLKPRFIVTRGGVTSAIR